MFRRSPDRLPWPLLSIMAALVLSGCASNEFTFEADLPGDFQLTGDAQYSGATCEQPVTHRIFETPGHSERPQRVSFQVPLSTREGGCTRDLSRIEIQLDGDSADLAGTPTAPDQAFAILRFQDRLADAALRMPRKGVRIFDGQCRWLQPAPGELPMQQRTLQCQASDFMGNWLEGAPGGSLQRNELPGRIVRLAIGMAPDLPATATGQ
ncbi:hypothetical protein [Pseudomonas nitroreducens]|uniref:hypothetical protein n=1 Tax=Pseudomonas nitroreducens TaxID=46680 RepID=UPI00209FC97A|nr:hypothetical protein [Pseudomonas nitroreducens]MCP1623337.1 hypothetical protein [Pseudomonas nitroreducens]